MFRHMPPEVREDVSVPILQKSTMKTIPDNQRLAGERRRDPATELVIKQLMSKATVSTQLAQTAEKRCEDDNERAWPEPQRQEDATGSKSMRKVVQYSS